MNIIKSVFSISQNKPTNPNRNELLDFLRGGAMILVLLHHSGFPFGGWILAFHMPLFFILSGFTEGQRNSYIKQSFGSFVFKRFKRLVLPYFSFEIINLLIWYIKCIVNNESIPALSPFVSIITCLNTVSYSGLCGRLWFLPCMFVSSIYLWIALRFIKTKHGLLCAAGFCLFCSGITTHIIPFRLPFTIDTAFMSTAFMLIGYVLYRPLSFYMEKSHCITDIASCVLLLAILFYTYRGNEASMLMFINKYGEYLFSVIGAFAGSIAYIIIAKYIYYLFRRVSWLKDFVLWYSYNSLASFPVHLEIKCVLLLFGIPLFYKWWVMFLILLFGNVIIVNIINNYLPLILFQKRNKA